MNITNNPKLDFDRLKQYSPCPIIMDKTIEDYGGFYNPLTDEIRIYAYLNSIEFIYALIHEIKHAKDFHRGILLRISRKNAENRAFMIMVKYALRYGNSEHRKTVIDWIETAIDTNDNYYMALPKLKQTKAYKKLIKK